MRWILGIQLLGTGVTTFIGAIVTGGKEKDKVKRKPLMRVVSFGLSAAIVGAFVIVYGSNHLHRTPAIVGSASSSNIESIAANPVSLSPTDIADYENGVKFQVDNTFNVARIGIMSIEQGLNHGDYDIGQFHEKAQRVDNLAHHMYDMFTSLASNVPLAGITSQYDNLIKNQRFPLLSQYQTASHSDLHYLDSQFTSILDDKSSIDKQLLHIKSEVMGRVTKDAEAAAKTNNANIIPGQSKVVADGGLEDSAPIRKN